MSNSNNGGRGRLRSQNRLGPSRPRGRALAIRVTLAVAPLIGLLGLVQTAPADAVAQPVQSQNHSISSSALSLRVSGKIPYEPDALTDGTTPGNTSCSRIRKLQALVEAKLAEHSVFPSDAANLFQHWLDGTGTQVSLGQNSGVARELVTYPGFVNMNNKIQSYAAARFDQGQTTVTVPTPVSQFSPPTDSSPLTLLNFSNESRYPDLYWAFRGTQGLGVTGSVTKNNGRYTGKLTYTIDDTYGFRAVNGNSLMGNVATDMNYLQTHCGWPKYPTPRWFSDSLTVTVPFNRPVA
jgi:hypothetical protein